MPIFVDVAFPVGDNGHHGCRRQAFFAGFGNLQPAVGFPVLYRQLPVVGRRLARPDPVVEVRQPEAGAISRINSQQGMEKHVPRSLPLPTVPKPLTRPAWAWWFSSVESWIAST